MHAIKSSRAASSTRKSSKSKRTIALAAAAGLSFVLAGLQETVDATAIYWSGNHDANWGTTGGAAGTNWSSLPGANNATNPPTSASDVFFSIPTASNLNTVLGANFTINSLNFTSLESGNVTVGGSNTLTINAGGLSDSSGSVLIDTISTAVTLGASQQWSNTSSQPLIVSGAIGGGSSNVLTFAGGGQFNLSGANSYSGNTSLLNAGTTLDIGGPSGTLATGNITLDGGTQLIIDNLSGSNGNRIGDTVGITSNGAAIRLAGAAATETVGTLSAATGTTIVNVDSTSTLTFANWTHSVGGAVNFTGNGTAVVNGLSNNAAGIIGGWATVGNVGSAQNDSTGSGNVLDFATVGAGNTIVPLSSYTSTITGATNTTNVKLSTGTSTVGNGTTTTVSTLYMTGNANLMLGNTTSGTGTLIVANGGIIANAGNQTFGAGGPQINQVGNDIGSGVVSGSGTNGAPITGSITSGTADLVVTTTSFLRIDSTITNRGTNVVALVKDGSGILDISDGNNNIATNTYSGGTIVNGGVLVAKSDANFGFVPTTNSPTNIIMNGGEIRLTATITVNSHRGITVGPQGGTISYNGGNTSTLSGFLVTGSGGITYKDIPSFGLTASGFPSSSAFNACAIDVAYLSTNYAGPTTFLTVASLNTVQATSAVLFLGLSGVVPSTSAVTVTGLDNGLNPTATKAVLNLWGSTQTFGSLAGAGTIVNGNGTAASLTLGANNLSTIYSGNLGTTGLTWNVGGNNHSGGDNSAGTTGAISITKIGTGTQTFGGVDQYTGATQILGGKLVITGSLANTAVTVGNSTVGQSASLGGNGTIAGTVTVNASGHLAPALNLSTVSTLNLKNNLTINGNLTGTANTPNLDYLFGASGGNATIGVSDTISAPSGATGNFNLAGNVTLNITPILVGGNSTMGIGYYDLFNWTNSSGTFSNTGNFTINGSSTFNYAVVNAGGALDPSVGGGVVPANNVYLEVLQGNPALFWTGVNAGVANGNWTVGGPSNWVSTSGAAPYANGDNVTFDDGNISTSPAGATNLTVQAGGVSPNTVTFNNSGFNLTIGGGNITVAGVAGIVKNAGGSVTLNNPVVTTPTTTVNSGTLTIGGLLNSPAITANAGGTFAVSSGGSLASSTALTINNGAATFNNATQSIASLGDAAGNTTGVLTLNTTALTVTGTSTYDGTVAGNGSLAVSNGATLTLTNANTHGGGTSASGSGSTLVLANASGSATGSGPVSIGAGSTLSGTGFSTGALSLSGTLDPAGPGVIGTISIGALTSNANASLNIDASGIATNDVAAVTGNASFTGNQTINLDALTPVVGNYTIVTATTGLSIAGANFTVLASGPGFNPADLYAVLKVGNTLVLNVATPTVTWTGNVGGNWTNGDSGNWTSQFINGDNAVFDDNGFSNNISVDPAGVTMSSMLFNNSAFQYIIGGGPIGGAGGLTVNNNGMVTLTGNNTFTGGETITSAGTLSISHDASLGAVPGSVVANSITLNNGILQVTGITGNTTATINANRGIALGAGGGTINVATTATGTLAASEQAVQYGGVISGSGDLTVTGGIGTNSTAAPYLLQLGNTSTYTGNTTINNASVAVATTGTPINNILPATTVLTLTGNASFVLCNGTSNQALAGLIGDTTSRFITTNGSSASVLTINPAAAATYNFQGIVGATSFLNKTNGNDAELSVVIGGNGTQVFSGHNTYSGTTTINSGGTLRLNNSTSGGNGTGASAITVALGGQLGGTGSTGTGANVINGTITAGADATHAGNFTANGNSTWNSGGSYAWKLNDNAAPGSEGTLSDLLNLNGSGGLAMGLVGATPFTVFMQSFGGVTPTAGTAVANLPTGNSTFVIANVPNGITGVADLPSGSVTPFPLTGPNASVADNALFALNTSGFANQPSAATNGNAFLEFIGTGTGTNGTLDVAYSAAPEPGTMLLVLGGAVPMLTARRRRRAAAAKQEN